MLTFGFRTFYFRMYYSNILTIVEQNSRNSHTQAKANPPNIATLFITGLTDGD